MFVKWTKPTKTDSLCLPFQLKKKKKHIFSSQIRFTNANLLNYSIQLSVTEVDFFCILF